MRVLEADVYEVVNIRTVRSVQTYEIIESVNLRTGLAASINLFRDVEVIRLDPITLADFMANVETAPDGVVESIVRYHGMFWS